MNIHKNALATPYSRLPMARGVGAGERAVNVAADSCVSEQTVRKCVQRRQGGGENALLDRSSRRARVRGRSRSGCKACCVAFFALAFCARRLKVRQDARVILCVRRNVAYGSRRDMSHRAALVSIGADSRRPADQARLFGTGPALDRVPRHCVLTGSGAAECGEPGGVFG